ncbi:hypothetical protein BOX15_Mlig011525g3, partial [Macrostomum lignano]
ADAAMKLSKLRTWLASWPMELKIIFAAVLFNELIIYYYYSWAWWWKISSICGPPEGDVTFLIASDPQIQGYRDESQVLGWLTRWDADRFLYKGYSAALSAAKPSTLLFPGDLIDEGLSAPPAALSDYTARFRGLFLWPKRRRLILAGDNDVGGEAEPVSSGRVADYERQFGRLEGSAKAGQSMRLLWLRFYADAFGSQREIERHVASAYAHLAPNTPETGSVGFRILANHANLLTQRPTQFRHLLRLLRPHLVITGHRHRAFALRCDGCWSPAGAETVAPYPDKRGGPYATEPLDSAKFTLTDGIVYEIGSPTCSYRMGTLEVAYGYLAVRESDGRVCYVSLWLVSRFYWLGLYVLCLLLCAGYWLFRRIRAFGEIERSRLNAGRRPKSVHFGVA